MEAHSERDRHSPRFSILQLFRCVLGVALLVFIARVTDLGTDVVLLGGAVIAGTLCAGWLLRRGWRFVSAALCHAMVIIAYQVVLAALGWLVFSVSDASDFFVYRQANHISLMFFVYALAFSITWFFWVSSIADTLEALLVAMISIWLLSGHRNYQLDAPRNISDLAFRLGVEPQYLLLGFALGLASFLVSYFAFAHHRPLFGRGEEIRAGGRIRWAGSGLIVVLLLVGLGSYAAFVNQIYSRNLARASEGVGQGGKEGDSPLTFNSAVGQTKQPAALVRLETDYRANPWTPMLYLREGALSEFNGREFVVADRRFDNDVPKVGPNQIYTSPNLGGHESREKVVQSIYLLAKHETLFALDRVEAINPLKNPDPQRFLAAYQATSYAPNVPLEQLVGEEVGEPSWDAATRAHYLRAPGTLDSPDEILPSDLSQPALDPHREDRRYAALSRQLTEALTGPVMKAQAVIEYLSEKSIYTRSPGHQVTQQGDPVAPYLFADEKRGYCVHFSHAAVYLLRLAGVPARIATGYLTDLSYAKDGHILLHVGDRHAWPEIYVRGLGWVVADITPARAENEQTIIPDEKLLDELMNKLDPAELLAGPLPAMPQPARGDQGLAEVIFQKKNIIIGAIVLILAFLIGKALLWFGFLLPIGPRRRIRYAYAAFESRMIDAGLPRGFGETRREYARRLYRDAGVDALALAFVKERALYSRDEVSEVAREIGTAWNRFRTTSKQSRAAIWRIVSFFNPYSLFVVKWRM